MSKNQLIAKIARQMKNGPWEALQLIGIREAQISKFVHNFNDEIECEILTNFVKTTIVLPSQELLNLYKEQEPEYWLRIEALSVGDPLPEVIRFKRLKTNLRKAWNSRPRFENVRLKKNVD